MRRLFRKYADVLSVIRLKPHDITLAGSRSKERYRRIALTSFAAIGARGIGAITSLISVPLTIHYLGAERYGLWMTISSVIAMLGFADLGMGNGLVNAISEADGKSDTEAAKNYVSSAFFLLLGTAVVLLSVLSVSYHYLPWQHIYNLHSPLAIKEAGPSSAILVGSFLVSMPLGIVQRIQIGYQEGYKSNIWGALGAVLGLIGVLTAIYAKAGLPWLVLAMTGGPFLATLGNWYQLFHITKRWLLPRWAYFSYSAGRKVASTGILFLILQLSLFIGNASDNLVIAQIFGAASVAGYAITQKIFIATQFSQYFTSSLWPAFGEALARNDIAWARKTFIRALKLGFVTGAVTAVPLIIFGKQIISLWVQIDFAPSYPLLLGFGVYILLAGYGSTVSMLLNTSRLLPKQIGFQVVAAIVSVILKIVFATNWGIAGVIWATVVGYGIFYGYPSARLAHSALNENQSLDGQLKN